MNPKFRVSINSPQSGFMSVGLKFGRKRFLAAMAHRPYPSLEELMAALAAIINGAPEATVRWNEDPEEFDFYFHRSGDQVQLDVTRHSAEQRAPGQGELVFHADGSTAEICLPFWETLRAIEQDLATDDFAGNWRRKFPTAEFRKLEQAVGVHLSI
jgi:hypothetical protein